MIKYSKIKIFFLCSIVLIMTMISLIYITTSSYQYSKFAEKDRTYIESVYADILNSDRHKQAVVIGAEIAYKDINYLIDRNYDIMAYDMHQIAFEFWINDFRPNHTKITVSEKGDICNIPYNDLTMARYILPYLNDENFETAWQQINSKINSGGYFIGNFFGPDFKILGENYIQGKNSKNMNFKTKQQIVNLFKDYTILKFKEYNKPHNYGGNEHIFEIFAKKN